MVDINGGPVGVTLFIFFIMAVGAALMESFHWVRLWRARRITVKEQQDRWANRITFLIAETRRLLGEDAKAVNVFIDEFGRDLIEEFSDQPWIKEVTLHDLRNHVECAVFDLIQGCPCGNCHGVSNGGPFWVEAHFDPKNGGLVLQGVISRATTTMEIACRPPERVKPPDHPQWKQQGSPGHNVELVCGCGKPVVTSIDHIAEGKPVKCAACIAGGARA